MVLDGMMSQDVPEGCSNPIAASEMETPGGEGGGTGNEPSPAFRKGPPRWRGNRDLLTMLYCLWRRRRYISSARLFSDKKAWEQTLKDLGQVTAQEFLENHGIVWEGRFHDGSVAERSSAQARESSPEDTQLVYDPGRRDERSQDHASSCGLWVSIVVGSTFSFHYSERRRHEACYGEAALRR